jgi:hypothetical protein
MEEKKENFPKKKPVMINPDAFLNLVPESTP